MKYFYRLLMLCLVVEALSGTGVATGQNQRGGKTKPNIVLIFVDDLGYGELGCQGNREILTPHIDSIAKNGIRFTDGYVSSPYCCPSRAGLLTGRYQTRFGHELNAVGDQNIRPNVGLPLTEVTIADVLKRAGYVTGCIGKWHLGGTAKYHPQKRGFDEFYGFLHEGHFFVPPPYKGVTSRLRPNEPPYDKNNSMLRGTKKIVEKEYLTDAITREALSFLERHKSKPFFLYLPYNAVHSPMQAPHKYLDRNKHIDDSHRRLFAAMLTSLDDGIGRVLAKLRELKLEEETVVILLSDNGGPVAELTSSNWPLRGGKGQLWEGGVRIPFLIQWKGQLPAGKTYPHPVISLDLFPTVAAVGGAKLPDERKLDGVNLLPFLTKQSTKEKPHDVLFWRYGANIALRQGKWKLVKQRKRGQRKPPRFELFDLSKDIRETSNLATRQPKKFQALKAELHKLNQQMIEPLWGRRRK
ncbi:MAG: sulfatase [Gemmataceae bacterium]